MEAQTIIPAKLHPLVEWLQNNRILVSVIGAVAVVIISALVHYKNAKAEEEVIKAISEYQKTLLGVGGEIHYDSVECSGIFDTQCDINEISISFLGQEQLSAKVIRFGDIAEFAKMEELKEGKDIEMDFDFSAQELSLPKPMMAEMVRQNVSEAFAQNTLEKLQTIDIELKGTFKGNNSMIDTLELDHLNIDNMIMPIRISLVGRNVSSESLEKMVLDSFSITFEDKAISDVTYESIAQFAKLLSAEEQELFLKNFKLVPKDLQERAKASRIINNTLADELESELKQATGKTQHQLIEALVKILRKEAEEVTIQVQNDKGVSFEVLQKILSESNGENEGVSISISAD